MNNEKSRILWGLALLLLGALFLGFNLGLLPQFDDFLWASFFAVLSVLFFVTYVSSGIYSWGWLFPATILGAISTVIYLSSISLYEEALGAVIMAAVALPFWVALFLSKDNWWALIPAGAISVIALVIVLSSLSIQGEFIGAVFMLGLGFIFIMIYFLDSNRWWSLIPGGVISTIGLTTLSAGFPLPDSLVDRLPPVFFFGGLALTFTVLWFLREKHNTGWGRYPAVPLGAISLIWLIAGTDFDLFWPAAMIAGGLYFLLCSRSKPVD